MSICSEPGCGATLAVNKRRKGTRCQRCAARVVGRSAEAHARASKSMKARFEDPAFRDAHAKRCAKGLRRAIRERPDLRDRLREAGRRVGKAYGGLNWGPAGSPVRRAVGKAMTERHLGWCPLEYRDTYKALVRRDRIPAAEARTMIEELIERDKARFAATGQLQQSARLG